MKYFRFIFPIFIMSFVVAAPFLAHADAAQGFVPLTNIPGLKDAAAASGTGDLTAFLNAIYKICVGLAAVLAVLQIVRGGITYMLGGSVTEVRQARHYILSAIFGLLLVLSPYIVFSIINPSILSLKINTSGLSPGAAQAPSASQPSGAASTCPFHDVEIVSAPENCAGASIPGTPEVTNAPASCCAGVTAGSVCCGVPN